MLLASDYDKTKYLKAVDLEREKKFRIKAVTAEELGIGKDKETKLVVWFTNDDRGLALNKTNNRTLRGAFGDDTAGWVNKVIVVFPTMVDVRGKMERALRVRIPTAEAGCGSGSANTAGVTGTVRQWCCGSSTGTGGTACRSGARTGSEAHFTAEQDDELNDEIPEKW